MFTGIVEAKGTVTNILFINGNIDITIDAPFTNELKIDQSISHNGACLTVIGIEKNEYKVTAIKETLEKTNLKYLNVGHIINLERSMLMNGRLDGHIVQGHVDQTGICTMIEKHEGSSIFTFEYDNSIANNITVEKGSICINGVSLTVINSTTNSFAVAIIPYTFEHTNFCNLKQNDTVNLEFDIIGKYVSRYTQFYQKQN